MTWLVIRFGKPLFTYYRNAPGICQSEKAWMLPRPARKHCLRRVDAVPRQAIFLIEPAHNSHTRLAGTKIHLVFKVMLLIGSLSGHDGIVRPE